MTNIILKSYFFVSLPSNSRQFEQQLMKNPKRALVLNY